MKKFFEKFKARVVSLCVKYKKKIVMALALAFCIAIDQISKVLVVNNLDYINERGSITLIKHILNLTYTENRGAAFGMLDDQRWIFMTISVIAIIGIGIYLFAFCKEGWLFQLGLTLIVSGGIGNMIDRIALGYVVDMLEFDFMEFAIFNVADSFICIGAGLVILMLIIEIIKDSKKSKQESKEIVVELEAENDNN